MAATQQFTRKVLPCCPSIVCPDGFVYLPKAKRCFKVIRESLSWDDSQRKCSSLQSGAHLAFVRSHEESDAIVSYLKSLKSEDIQGCGNNYYTGGQRVNPNDCKTGFVWKLNNTEILPIHYTNWYTNEPNCHGGSESCLIYRSDLNYQWNDDVCSRSICSLCEVNTAD